MTTFIFEAAQPSPCKILIIGIFKMQPKLVVVLVLGTTEPLEFSLILKKWPSALNFNCCLFLAEKRAKTAKKNTKSGNRLQFHQMVQKAQFKSQFQHFWGILGVYKWYRLFNSIESVISEVGQFWQKSPKMSNSGHSKIALLFEWSSQFYLYTPKIPQIYWNLLLNGAFCTIWWNCGQFPLLFFGAVFAVSFAKKGQQLKRNAESHFWSMRLNSRCSVVPKTNKKHNFWLHLKKSFFWIWGDFAPT